MANNLTNEAKAAILSHMLKLFGIGGSIVGILGFVLGFMIKELATETAITTALQKIQQPLIDATGQVSDALKNAKEVNKEVEIFKTELTNLEASVKPERIISKVAEILSKDTNFQREVKRPLAKQISSLNDLVSTGNAALVPRVQALEAGSESLMGLPKQVTLLEARSIPTSAVVAFSIEKCPEGWKLFTKGEGRMIVGVGQGPLKKSVGLLDKNGKEELVLKKSQMPKHDHGLLTVLDNAPLPPPTSARRHVPIAGTYNQLYPRDFSEGSGTAVRIMPPYIALTLCRKD